MMRRLQLRFTGSFTLLIVFAILLSGLPVTPSAVAQDPTDPAPSQIETDATPTLARPQTALPTNPNPVQQLGNSDPNTPVTPLYVVPPDETGVASASMPTATLPELDLRPMIAEWQAAGSPTNTPIFDQTNLARLQAMAPAPNCPLIPRGWSQLAPIKPMRRA